jgi:hypothetical protein
MKIIHEILSFLLAGAVKVLLALIWIGGEKLCRN